MSTFGRTVRCAEKSHRNVVCTTCSSMTSSTITWTAAHLFGEEHLQLAREAHQRGELVLAGAFADPPDGAALVFNVDDVSHRGAVRSE